MRFFAALEESHPQQRVMRKVEGTGGRDGCLPLQLFLLFRRRNMAEIYDAQLWIVSRGNDLDRTVLAKRKCATQYFMTANDFAETLCQDRDIERAIQRKSARHVDDRAGPVVLIEKPQSLLGK